METCTDPKWEIRYFCFIIKCSKREIYIPKDGTHSFLGVLFIYIAIIGYIFVLLEKAFIYDK